ncbi:hypothetical protein M406DRAFT_285995 [Cryphonectria parasitica EP155]|uniref:Poly [ADP-ribose] polymerase n=1 Tax=Cryphonectria parasitica (strain ATCC 38755 / EP155) TaxID=660469 RepID=A0A9P4YCQ0_CRYP1|nr:uncharacterized protein M406DRAFT_285995 [Cryphonectria parasitica EP155]KAF3771114.1 hypothetical protein M406DRAFT_285995 [Cryphonectria parasitica EP155]
MPAAKKATKRGGAANSASAATSAGTPPLDGCCVAFSGNFPGQTQASLLTHAARLGAQTSKSVSQDVTHLISTQNDCDKPSTKCIQAIDRGIALVSLDWLLQSESHDAKQPEANFALTTTKGSPAATPAPDPAAQQDPKKRSASDSTAPDPKKVKLDANGKEIPTFGSAQIAKNSAVRVEVDEGCSLTGYTVHIGDDSVIWDASLNQTNAGENHNKFYRIQLLVGPGGHCQTWTRWGRVGEPGQSAVLGDGSMASAKQNFEKKFKDKSGLAWANRTDPPKPKKYFYIERNYDPDSDDDDGPGASNADAVEERKAPRCTLDPEVKKLVQLIFDPKLFAATMSDMRYDDKKLPLGKLSKATIMRGYEALKELSDLIGPASNAADDDSIEAISNRYYSLIPHVFGRNRPPVLNNMVMVKREIDLLDALSDLKDASNIMKGGADEQDPVHPLDRQFQGLKLQEMTPLDPQGSEFEYLKTYLMNTRGVTHNANYRIENIFRIERQGEKDRFNQSVFAGPARDRRLLWHGSRATNFGGILSQGLRIAPPEAPATGYMFGKGVYLADMSSKSANYCYHRISNGTALLLLCEAELGTPMLELTSFNYTAPEDAAANGCWSTFGKGGTSPSVWEDAGCIHPSLQGVKVPDTKAAPPKRNDSIASSLVYNEYICYDVAQIRLRYLFRVKM